MARSALTIGKFDGFHRGHRLLLDRVLANTDEDIDALCFKIRLPGQGILSPEEETELIDALSQGRCQLHTVQFTSELMNMTPESFVKDVLVKELGAAYVAVGVDFRFGKDRAGDIETLTALGKLYGFRVEAIEKLRLYGDVVSSSRVRAALEAGDIPLVQGLTGRDYILRGTVAGGKRLGRTLGYPTINLKVSPDKLLPRYGVYSSEVRIEGDDRLYSSITNIGVRPSIDDGELPTIETFIYDFDGDIYGAEVRLNLRHFLRGERHFTSLEALTKQIEMDIVEARDL